MPGLRTSGPLIPLDSSLQKTEARSMTTGLLSLLHVIFRQNSPFFFLRFGRNGSNV